MEPVRLAIIGAGQIGAKHAELVRAHETCSLAGVCDVDPMRKIVSEAAGARFYQSVEELLRRGAVRDGDLVILTKGDLMGVMGGTNAMKIIRVGDPMP